MNNVITKKYKQSIISEVVTGKFKVIENKISAIYSCQFNVIL